MGQPDINQLQHDSLFAQDIRFDPNDSVPDYIGLHAETSADVSATGWIIFKFTYSGSNVTRIQKTKGKYADRTTLF